MLFDDWKNHLHSKAKATQNVLANAETISRKSSFCMPGDQ